MGDLRKAKNRRVVFLPDLVQRPGVLRDAGSFLFICCLILLPPVLPVSCRKPELPESGVEAEPEPVADSAEVRVRWQEPGSSEPTYFCWSLYQSDYDPDLQGTYLAVSRDPWGIGITYTGYALLFVSLIWMLITDRLAVKGKRMRRSTLFYTLFLLACFVLLLTHFMRKYSPETHPLPVLNSRLLPIHVSTIMMAYVLFVILALQSLVALIAHWIAAKGREVRQLSLLSRGTHFNLKLALTLLATGIMLGAIWANQSWGRYWGWDPKEVWALITLMVYAVPLHAFQREYINIGNPKGQRTKVNVECQMVNGKWLNGKWSNSKWYYLYLLLAPLSVAITYFGVNFFLGGMHSYA